LLDYSATKGAIHAFTKSLASNLLTQGIRVNAVAPGPVQTPMLDRLTQTSERKAAFLDTVPLKRAGTPDEIAEAIVYVASAGFMTGEVLRVNGGRTAS